MATGSGIVEASVAFSAFVSCPKSQGRVLASALPSRSLHQELGASIARINCKRCNQHLNHVAPVSSSLASAQPTVSVRNPEKSIQLPIDYYQILGADSHYSADAIIRACESRVSNPPREGFSQEVLMARQQILKVACDTLADRDLREEYDNGLKEDEAGTLVVEVPWSKIPGALCLLQEVGEAEVVVQVGEAILEDRLKMPFHHDVVLAMALAYVDLSREAIAESPPAVVRSCDMLNAALRLLQDGGGLLAPSLQEQIYETLEDITPRCVLELLGLPLDDEHKAQRAEGLQEVRSILWTAGEGGLMAPIGGFTREQFMKEALSRMTASEQVALFTETPSSIPAEKLEVYSAALAHVAEGFKTRKPQLIQEANNLFMQLQQSLHRPNGVNQITDEQRDVLLGRALSALLLGEVENCKAVLGLNDSNSPLRCPEVVEFILSHSEGNEDDDILPGMCKLLESWLAEEVFTHFRETVDTHVSLSDYYDDPKVLGYLEKLEKGTSPLEAAAAIVRIGAGASAALDSVRTTFQKVFPLRKAPSKSEQKEVMDEDPMSEDVYDNPMDDSSSLVTYDHTYADSARGPNQSRHGPLPLQIACIGALLGGLVIAGYRYQSLHDKVLTHWREVPILTAISSAMTSRKGNTESVLSKEIPRMDARLAEQLIRKWQSAKAQALGTSHVVTQLNEILDGEMLKIWTDRALEVAKHGWHWEYKLLELSIDSVTISEDGTRATVEATLQEAARLYDNQNPEHNDSYKSSYTTRYELQCGEAGWKITGGAVLRT